MKNNNCKDYNLPYCLCLEIITKYVDVEADRQSIYGKLLATHLKSDVEVLLQQPSTSGCVTWVFSRREVTRLSTKATEAVETCRLNVIEACTEDKDFQDLRRLL